LYSLLLPGLGQLYLGEKREAKLFLLGEAAVWTAFVVFRVEGRLREDAYKEYAVTHAGLGSRNHSDAFYRIIGDYNSAEEYEEFLKMEGRYQAYYDDPTDPQADYQALEDFYLSSRVRDFEPWKWTSTEDRRFYHRLRSGSRQAYRRAVYMLAAAAVNRVASAVLAARSARAGGRGEEVGRWQIRVGPDEEAEIGIFLSRGF